MNAMMLPVYPRPFNDELLSSWIERIGLFYGCDYEHFLVSLVCADGVTLAARDNDVDTDEGIRQCLHRLTGLAESCIPQVIQNPAWMVLPKTARLAFCPRCWDDDSRHGRQPYIRRRWVNWFDVTCPFHRCFLTARPPGGHDESTNRGWAPWWQTQPHWAATLELPVRSPTGRFGQSYEPGSVGILASGTSTPLLNEIRRVQLAVTENRSSSHAPRTPNAINLAKHAWSTALARVPSGINELLFGSHAARAWWPMEPDIERVSRETCRPLLLENRIGVLATAAELLRMIERRPPIHADLANVVRAAFGEQHLPSRRNLTIGETLVQFEGKSRPGKNGAGRYQSHH